MRYENLHFKDETVKVDGNEYQNCVFTESRVVFTGGIPPRFTGCVFDRCQWVFDEAAENTIQYFAALYSGLGQGGRELIEGLFDSIRHESVGHGTRMSGSTEPALR